jgi:hypothetical protein
MTEEIPSYSHSVKPIPREQRHQLLHLPSKLWSLVLGYPLLWNVPDVAQRAAVELFADVEPFLIPIGERCVPRTVEVFLFHLVPECQVHSAHDFGAALGSFLPQAEQISKEVEMGLDSPIRLTKKDENRNKEDQVRMQIADSNLVIQAETLQKWMDRNPKTPLEEIFEDDYLTRLGIGVVVAVYWPPSF